MARLGRAQPAPPIIERNTLQDPPVLTTRAPVVVIGSAGRRGRPNAARVVRNTLQDPPVLTTKPPVMMIGAPGRRGQPNPVTVLRSSLQDVAPPTVDVRPQALVIVSQKPKAVLLSPITSRGSFEDFATPRPVVVVPKGPKPGSATIVTGRGSIETPVVADITRPLLVLTPVASRPATLRLIVSRNGQAAVVPPIPPSGDVDWCLEGIRLPWDTGLLELVWDTGYIRFNWDTGPVEDC